MFTVLLLPEIDSKSTQKGERNGKKIQLTNTVHTVELYSSLLERIRIPRAGSTLVLNKWNGASDGLVGWFLDFWVSQIDLPLDPCQFSLGPAACYC